nr:PREDICTED: protocadherin Fat 3-like [Notothenia coriiceps]
MASESEGCAISCGAPAIKLWYSLVTRSAAGGLPWTPDPEVPDNGKRSHPPHWNGERIIRTAISNMDRESSVQYAVVVQAKDMAGSVGGLSGSTTVNVNLTDVNDNPPKFLQRSYQLYAPELAPVGKAVGRIRASDQDEGQNAEMTYRITNADAAAIFTITTDAERREGFVSLKKMETGQENQGCVRDCLACGSGYIMSFHPSPGDSPIISPLRTEGTDMGPGVGPTYDPVIPISATTALPSIGGILLELPEIIYKAAAWRNLSSGRCTISAAAEHSLATVVLGVHTRTLCQSGVYSRRVEQRGRPHVEVLDKGTGASTPSWFPRCGAGLGVRRWICSLHAERGMCSLVLPENYFNLEGCTFYKSQSC